MDAQRAVVMNPREAGLLLDRHQESDCCPRFLRRLHEWSCKINVREADHLFDRHGNDSEVSDHWPCFFDAASWAVGMNGSETGPLLDCHEKVSDCWSHFATAPS